MKFGNISKVIDAERAQKIVSEAEKEIERISFLSSQFMKDNKLSIDETVGYIMQKGGYAKSIYIPYDTDNLFILTQLSLRYMRKYNIRPEEFINRLKGNYEYCLKCGYAIDVNQKTLEVLDA